MWWRSGFSCDGNIDGFSVSCYPGGVSGCAETSPGIFSCEGICSSGLQVCTDGSFGSCTGAVTPQTEVCDGVDNDCDGQIDEELGSTTCGLGVCEHTVQNCVGGTAQSCDPMEGSSPEICDGLDNDCDGQIDEGLAQDCYPGGTAGCTETSPGVFSCDGICQVGTSVCSAGSWGSCQGSIIPNTEVCNNLDDDCNGLVDDNVERACYTGPEGTEGTGECTGGTQTCSSGSWSVCTGEVKPGPEVCNGLDDDCNGSIDDMGSTTCGLGVCEHTVQNCESGTSQTCDPMEGASAELCDGLDNDCDGQVDGLSSGCYPAGDSGCSWDSGSGSYICEGTCSPGLQFCPVNGDGTWGACQGASTPVEELCDNLDNDCDGQIDEDLEQFCYPPGSGPDTGCEETGDGSWICTGECTVGLRQCSSGSWTSCQGLTVPTSEICDGLDNDCDGEVDENSDIPGMGEPCGGVGVCAPGIRACINGQVVCEGGGEPQPGLCDGLDNNCNGLVDEAEEIADDPAMGAPCGETVGECQQGQNECIDGEVVCVGGVVPTEEICNGLDDNCDGVIDNGELCSGNEICYEADCRPLCDPSEEQSCGAGYSCIEVDLSEENGGGTEDICYPQLAPCGGVYCNENEVCREGTCVNPCLDEPCADYESCIVNRYSGQVGHENEPEYYCVDTSCSSATVNCPSGKLCIEHECVDDPCSAIDCEHGSEYCVRTGCESGSSECTASCSPIPYCDSHEKWDAASESCVSDPCHGVECESGEICLEGSCESNPCLGVYCDQDQQCIGGECISDPCSRLSCPFYTSCTIDPLDGSAWCQPNEGVWEPGVQGDSMTTTGGGLFSCSSTSSESSHSEGYLGGLFLLLLLVVHRFRRFFRFLFMTKAQGRSSLLISGLLVTGLVFSGGCDYKEYTLSEEGHLNIPDGGTDADVEDVEDVEEDADSCVPSEEVCDGVDNDCNGIVDDYWTSSEEGGEGHFADDIFNCGSCGNICAFMHADSQCVDGSCVMGDCDTNWYDFNDDPSDGCEQSCVISSGGQEICDGVDNDCNGIIDDYWVPPAAGGQGHFLDDPMNCGECGRVCAFPNGEGSCDNGDCVLSSCQAGYADADGVSGNGCECIITGTDDSTCDGVDNDCDGQTDEDAGGEECYTGAGCVDNGDGSFTCTGQCATGTAICSGGQTQCQGQTGPELEICDGLDNDCDGQIDEGYDLQIDVNNCGSCGNQCSLPNAVTRCEGGNCVISFCSQNYHDLNGLASDGCEYNCTLSNSGIERCDDGIDNDCDGTIDEFNSDSDVNNCGSCGYSCSSHAPSNMDVTGCSSGICQYTCANNYYDYDGNSSNGCEYFCAESNGGVEACDGADNDCDGQTDEGFDKETDVNNCGSCGYSCSSNAPDNMQVTGCSGGVCQYSCQSGYYNLDGLQTNGCEYACTESNSGVEICDGLDNDCDGQTDEDGAGLSLTQSCYTGPAGTEGVGVCNSGTETCSEGVWGNCLGEALPGTESCDGADNDCDGSIDEDFDQNTDILNCGGCGNSCFSSAPANTNATGCSGGVCQYSCKLNYYDRNGDILSDGCEEFCEMTNGGVERCDDGIDNDCDGVVDEFDSDNDVNNCGSCGYSCSANAPDYMDVTGCSGGVCQYVCASNYHDLDGSSSNGCEYYCSPSNGGTEVCDGADNDCDGNIDEDFDTNTDLDNCGSCGYSCSNNAPDNMQVTGCSGGVCQYSCQSGYYNLDGLQTNGCEYACTESNSGVEICDGLDNDCDGQTDEDGAGLPLTQSCYTGPAGTEGVGVCSSGTETCGSGSWGSCLGESLPGTESCDGADNDCDGDIDEDFDQNTDILNCGGCGNSCFSSAPANTNATGCSGGVCQYVCVSGYHDVNGDINDPLGDGCEYACDQAAPDGTEYCNDVDDDCDGDIDEATDLVPPPSGYCKTGGGCGAVVNSYCELFEGDKQWVCDYPSQVERMSGSPNEVAYSESLCDDYDNDCNGQVDEDFLPIKGDPCSDGDYGLCEGTGTVVCKADLSGTECNITSKQSPQPEICDGVDNDCDGKTDEGPWDAGSNPSYVEDAVETIIVNGYEVQIYKYEASRSTATSSSAGIGNTRSCSKAGVKPWNRVTYLQAQRACSKSGIRLCTADEWYAGCEGGSGYLYPYGNTYDGLNCNGVDYGVDDVINTGDANQCYNSSSSTWDMSGNLKEWTSEYRGQSELNKRLYTVRGGSFYDHNSGLTCDFTSSVYVESVFTDNVGFRCCTTCGNGTVDAGEQCDDGNRVDGDGCDYMCASEAGQTCGNEIVEGSEECDDGNRIAGDGCSPACFDEPEPICGNGVIESDEECDDGNTILNDGCEYCQITPICGDSNVEAPEQCDDGNTNNGDGCDSDCQWEPVNCGGQMDSYGYEMCEGTLGFTDIRGTGTKLGNADDNVYSFGLSFNFSLYGTAYNSIDVNTNGNINFQSNSSYSNNSLPTGTYTMVISPLWDDLNSSNQSTQGVWAQNFGTSPNRYTVIQWYTEHYSSSGEVMFEVILHENGDMDFIYSDVYFSNSTYDYGASATVGIQGSSTASDGYYLQYSYNSASLNNGMSLTFHHP